MKIILLKIRTPFALLVIDLQINILLIYHTKILHECGIYKCCGNITFVQNGKNFMK